MPRKVFQAEQFDAADEFGGQHVDFDSGFFFVRFPAQAHALSASSFEVCWQVDQHQ
jgi:hypothetical protein